jgi:hypothetical protein
MATARYRGGWSGKDEQGTIPEHDPISQDNVNTIDKKPALFDKEGTATSEVRSYEDSGDLEEGTTEDNSVPETERDLITEVIHVEDDPSLNAWTFRMWFLGKSGSKLVEIEFRANCSKGIGLSTFGGSLATIYYFKPQTALVSQVFLAVVSYVIGEAMAKVIPTSGWIGRLFNPHPVRLCCASIHFRI